MSNHPGDSTGSAELGSFHRLFDRLYPLIRFWHEHVNRNPWFSEITPTLWVGGAPTYPKDYQFLLDHGIEAVMNIRAEREDDAAYYLQHNITYISYKIPDIAVPDQATIQSGTNWVSDQIAQGRVVLIHCAKGRGRSATLAAAYLMASEHATFDQANSLLVEKRPLTKLESRHQLVLEAWAKSRHEPDSGQGKK